MLVNCLETRPGQNGGSSAGIKAKDWTTCWRGSAGKVRGETKWISPDTEGLHVIEEREDHSRLKNGQPAGEGQRARCGGKQNGYLRI